MSSTSQIRVIISSAVLLILAAPALTAVQQVQPVLSVAADRIEAALPLDCGTTEAMRGRTVTNNNVAIDAYGGEFDGTSSYLHVVGPTVTDITWACWVKHDDLDGYQMYVCAFTKDEARNYRQLRMQENGKIHFGFQNYSEGHRLYISNEAVVSAGRWHWVCVREHSVDPPSVWVDGSEIEMTLTSSGGSPSSLPQSEGYRIGNNNYNGGSQYMDGHLDDVVLFNRFLSDDEIKKLYLLGLSKHRND